MLTRAGFAQHQAQLQAGLLGLHTVDDRREAELAALFAHRGRVHRAAGLRQAHELAQLRVAVRHQRRDRDAAELLQREVQHHELGHVGQGGHDAVQRLEAQLEQVERQVAADGIELRIGVAALAIDQRGALGITLEHGGELLRQRLVAPVALGAVARGVVLGKGHESFQHGVLLCAIRSRP